MIDFKKKLDEEDRMNGLYKEEEEIEKILPKKKKKRISNFLILAIVLFIIFSGKIIMSSPGAVEWMETNNFFSTIKQLTPSLDKNLKGENYDRINILLLGIGGGDHDGAYLTDTMILASLKPSTKEVSLISFPRDLVSPVNDWQKINSIHAYAEMNNHGSGGKKTIESMEELLDIDIPYYIRVDFAGFSKIIDDLGGIKIDVENSFTDYKYPIMGEEDNPDYYSRFEVLSFKEGPQKMDGETALKYARSRHAAGIEGSDYARARRQQLVIQAIKDKALSGDVLLNPSTISKVLNELEKNISTNLEIWEIIKLWNIGKDIEKKDISSFVLNDAPDNYLIASRGENGAFILVPRTGNYNNINEMVKDIFKPEEEKETNISNNYIQVRQASEDLSVSVLNGTWINGLAGRTSAVVKQSGFDVFEVANAPQRDYNQTTVYSLNKEANEDYDLLSEITSAKKSYTTPEWTEEYINATTSPDFILVLGTDSNK
ncbi:MAG: LCP family protein [Patescibacteria group bacterium]|jgi:LCP family protein required for cell wall assembly|nr:LCP family protein [Patescibacteria group bacterium]